MKFWDASAIVPLLVAEESTRRLQALAAKDSAMLVWWGSAVECISALARLERDGALSSPAMTLALQRLQQLSAGWHEIDPSDEIRETAARFLRVHPLRDRRCAAIGRGLRGRRAAASITGNGDA